MGRERMTQLRRKLRRLRLWTKFLQFLLVLSVAGLFTFVYMMKRDLLTAKKEHTYDKSLDLLDQLYEIRIANIKEEHRKKREEAKTEIGEFQTQIEETKVLEEAFSQYFQSRKEIMRGETDVIRRRWKKELEEIGRIEGSR